ncbi:MAG: hypothetical protein ACR2I0_03385, partial [Rhodoferax sp.]
FNYIDVDPVDGKTKISKSLPVINKAIQELFDPIFGRMNATLAVELPFSTSTTATTIPLAYIDVPVDRLDAIGDGETQIWKITHNGVDGHPVHFHMVNVQVINRVGWDGTIKPPDANEVGWKETLRMNPLEDVYVAVKARRPVVPFGVPKSARVLDPSQAIGAKLGFTNIDPTSGQAPTQQWQIVAPGTVNVSVPVSTGQYSNQLTDFDNEYVWHCHILGHEEQDFMRPFIFHPKVITPDAPAFVTASGNLVSWIDTTPVGGQDAQGIPTAGRNAAYPDVTSSPKNEIGFKIYRGATGVLPADMSLVAIVPANTTRWVDAASSSATSDYAVVAFNVAGDSLPGTSTTTTTASATVVAGSGTTYTSGTGVAVASAVTGPTGLTQTLNTGGSITLRWGAVAGATSYLLSIDGGAANVANGGFEVTVAATLTRYTVAATSLKAGINHTFTVTAMTLSGATAGASTTVYNGKAYTPVAFSAGPGTGTAAVALGWANDARNINNVTGLALTWSSGTRLVGSMTFDPKTKGATVIGLTSGTSYNFSLVANSRNGNSVATSTLAVVAP